MTETFSALRPGIPLVVATATPRRSASWSVTLALGGQHVHPCCLPRLVPYGSLREQPHGYEYTYNNRVTTHETINDALRLAADQFIDERHLSLVDCTRYRVY
jgi:hypothetical protein